MANSTESGNGAVSTDISTEIVGTDITTDTKLPSTRKEYEERLREVFPTFPRRFVKKLASAFPASGPEEEEQNNNGAVIVSPTEDDAESAALVEAIQALTARIK